MYTGAEFQKSTALNASESADHSEFYLIVEMERKKKKVGSIIQSNTCKLGELSPIPAAISSNISH